MHQRAARKPGLRIKWTELEERLDDAGRPLKRFYKVDTFSSALNKQILDKGGFVANTIEAVLGRVPLSSMSFQLVHENAYRFVFRARVVNKNGKRASFGVVAAKNAEEFSSLLRREYLNLSGLHEQAPRLVIRPFGDGNVYLPDRHRRRELGRDIYTYTAEWPTAHSALRIGKSRQFFVDAPRNVAFSQQEAERIKQRIVEIVVRTYDPDQRTSVELQSLVPDDFVVTRPRGGSPRLKLIGCRQLQRNVSPQKLIHGLVVAKWKIAGTDFPLQPADPKWFVESILNAAGKTDGAAWLGRYAAAVRRKTLPESRRLPLDLLVELGFGAGGKA